MAEGIGFDGKRFSVTGDIGPAALVDGGGAQLLNTSMARGSLLPGTVVHASTGGALPTPGGALRMLVLAALLVLACSPLRAESLLDLDVAYAEGRYRLRADMSIDAPAAAVRARLTDYANLTALNPSIRHSSVRAAKPPFAARVTTVIQACMQMLCRTLRRVEDVREMPRRLVALIVPDDSDFSAGRTEWRLVPRGEDAVLVQYRAWLTPAFAVPPVVGPALVRQGMERELRTLLRNLERLARAAS